jgi:hypothetical protein
MPGGAALIARYGRSPKPFYRERARDVGFGWTPRKGAHVDTIHRQTPDDLRAALEGDPRIPCADEITVENNGQLATVSGTIGSCSPRTRRAVGTASFAHVGGPIFGVAVRG